MARVRRRSCRDRRHHLGVGDALALAGAVFQIGKTLRLSTVAEGVEHASQAAKLLHIGCDQAQGFHYARPMPASEIDVLLRRSAVSRRAG